MNAFADLFAALDETTGTNAKVEALVRYFAEADPADASWAVYFLVGRKPRQAVPSKKLREWAAAEAGIPDWLLGECYDAVGDSAEAIALLLPEAERSSDRPLAEWVEGLLLTLRDRDEEDQRRLLLDAWAEMDRTQRFVWNKLISGQFRVGVSAQLVTRALAKAGGLEPGAVAHRLMGNWTPSADFYRALIHPDSADADLSRPYPFCLAHPIDEAGDMPQALGDPVGWQAEWKWDGIRCQLIRRGGETFLWTRGEELVTERYPELAGLGPMLPEGTAIDGEILVYRDDEVRPFAQLQRRIGRKTVGKKLLAEVPVALFAFDLLEDGGEDLRSRPLRDRRARLADLVAATNVPGRLILSPTVQGASWADLAEHRASSRDNLAEGLMLKRLDSIYQVGRVRGDWWKWKIAPITVDAVLTAAQRGSGKRASLYTDYTFSVWDESGNLVPFAKAYSGLTDEEIRRVDAWIRRHMVEKFGPVRTVTPELVFELAFEGIQRSTRHKSGVAVRFPRILRWRSDKTPEEADRLEAIRAMLPGGAGG
ncbi:ATP-dependent DNA ligase [Tautonia plasticadhaerens]|uniref:DNA ligase (ATP) n=1 Tax=Tautonia plasticadhaerens TaxID=2527974 RepID=A0A518HD51_9BACT|nr:ATP-dependent DNA ligase [Tautonia plasticadhaerens]QDV38596.1 Putative DNA ligase-like protein [Tautonia plasticadhaerens]